MEVVYEDVTAGFPRGMGAQIELGPKKVNSTTEELPEWNVE